MVVCFSAVAHGPQQLVVDRLELLDLFQVYPLSTMVLPNTMMLGVTLGREDLICIVTAILFPANAVNDQMHQPTGRIVRKRFRIFPSH